MRILIVDDEVLVANLLADALREAGGVDEVMVVTSGEEALGLLERGLPDAVFLDVAMPEMNGVELLRRIRAKHQALPVLLITGHADTEQIELAESLGVSDIIEKPFILKSLSETIEAITNRETEFKG